MDSSTRSKWQVRLAVMSVFAVGFVAGALATNIYRDRQAASRYSRPRGSFEHILDKLQLSQEQRSQVDAILDDSRAQLMEMRKESEPKFREVRKRTDDRLKEVLTQEQWDKFEQMRGEFRHPRPFGAEKPRRE